MHDVINNEVMTEEEKCKNLQWIIDENPNNYFKIYLNGKNALHLACELGLYQVVQLLVNHHWPLNEQDTDGNTPLHLAAKTAPVLEHLFNPYEPSCLHGILILLSNQSGIEINAVNLMGNTPLHEAAIKQSVQSVKILARHPHRDLSLRNLDEQTVQEILEKLKPSERKNSLIQALNPQPFRFNEISKTILSFTITDIEKCENIQWLFYQNPKCRNANYQRGKNAVHLACEYSLVQVVQLLISYQWPLNEKDDYGNTALHIAASIPLSHNPFNRTELYDSLGILILLTKQPRIDINAVNMQGNTPLHEAALKGLTESIKILARHPHRDLQIRNKKGQTVQDIIDESINKKELTQALNTPPVTNVSLEEYNKSVFPEHPLKINKGSLKELTKQFKKLNITIFPVKPMEDLRKMQPTDFSRPYPHTNYHPSSLKILEVDFISGRLSKIVHYLNNDGDPNLSIPSTSTSPSLSMPLVFYAFLHRKELILIELIKHNAIFTKNCLREIHKHMALSEDDSYAEFVQNVQNMLFPTYIQKQTEANSTIKQWEQNFQKLLYEHRLGKNLYKYQIFELKEEVLDTLFKNNASMTRGIKFIYSICYTREFDPQHIRKCTLGILDQYQPEAVLEMLSALLPLLTESQQLIALYIVKEMLLVNIEFGYHLSSNFNNDLSKFLKKFYDVNLLNAILELNNLTQKLSQDSIVLCFKAFDTLSISYPSQRKSSIHEYLNNLFNSKEVNIEQAACFLANEFRSIIINVFKHCDLNEFRDILWENKNSNKNRTLSPHVVILDKKIEDITRFVANQIKAQASVEKKALAFTLFTHVAQKCLSNNELYDSDLNVALAISGGLWITPKSEIKLNSETTKIYEELCKFFDSAGNAKHARAFLECNPFSMPCFLYYYKDKLIMFEKRENMSLAVISTILLPLLNAKRKYKYYPNLSETDLDFQLYLSGLEQAMEISPRSASKIEPTLTDSQNLSNKQGSQRKSHVHLKRAKSHKQSSRIYDKENSSLSLHKSQEAQIMDISPRCLSTSLCDDNPPDQSLSPLSVQDHPPITFSYELKKNSKTSQPTSSDKHDNFQHEDKMVLKSKTSGKLSLSESIRGS